MIKEKISNLDAKKIIFIIPDVEIGGVEKNTLNFCNHLSKKFSDISIAYEKISNKNLKGRFDKSINFIKTSPSKTRSLFIQYKKLFAEHDPDYLVTSSFVILLNLIIAKKISKQDPKIIYKIETNLNKFLSSPSLKIDRVIYKFFSYFSFSNTDLLICSSLSIAESLKKDFKGKFNQKIICIYNPVITDEDRKERNKVSHPFFVKNDNKNVNLISIGRLIPSKGFGGLISVIAKLNNAKYKENFNLLIIGEGPEKNALLSIIKEKKLQENIDILNFNDFFLDYIFCSDIFLANSDFEGLNNNLIHALRQGKHVISSDCDFGPREILNNELYGSLVPVGNEQKMVDKILEVSMHLCSNEEIDLRIKRAEEFSAEKNSDLFFKAICSI